MFTLREVNNPLDWEPFLIEMEASFTQGLDYFKWQSGRETKRFIIDSGGETVAFFQAFRFPLILNKSYYYIPYGPVVRNSSPELLKFIKDSLEKIKDKNTVYVRLDFYPTFIENTDQNILSKYFYKVPKIFSAGSNFQPRQEWFLDIQKSENDIFENMHKNTRYSIRLSQKKGLRSEIITNNFGEYTQSFLNLMKITAKRNGFRLHPDEYYANIFRNLDEDNRYNSFLSVVYLGEKILAIDLIVVFGKIANYVFAGSSDEHRSLCPAYLAQWLAIVQAKKIGCTKYNFGGVKVGKESEWTGLTDYKVKFGGRLIEHSDFYDLIFQKSWYIIYLLRKILKKK